jgi:hypothetical protein
MQLIGGRSNDAFEKTEITEGTKNIRTANFMFAC